MYQYPDNPTKETLQQQNRLFRGDGRIVSSNTPSNVVLQNVNPNPVTSGAYQVPGSQVFGQGKAWQEMPQPVDIIHREINQPRIVEQLIYRSANQIGRRESPNYRVFAPSVTASPTSSATFNNGKQGDIYGS